MDVKRNIGKIVLGLLFVFYFIFRIPVPRIIGNTLVTAPGKIIATLLVLYLFLHTHPVLAILGLLVAADLIRRSSPDYIRYQEVAKHDYSAFNPYPFTLEQEMVTKMTPHVYKGQPLSAATFKPVLDKDYNATNVASVDYMLDTKIQ
jgi:hypothetical protein